MAAELAVGYVTLMASGAKLGDSIKDQLGAPLESEGKKGGNVLAGALMTGVKRVGIGAAATAGAALTTALVKGWGRLTAIEDAEAKLTGLGHSADSVDLIMANALGSVKGTAFGLGEAATIAASTVAAGIKPGEDLQRVLSLTGDAATIAGRSMGEMGSIFNKVAARNKLSMQEVNQLTDAGLPILQFLADQYGVTAEAAGEMVSRGQVDFAAFAQAIETNVGGAALASGNTTRGALANTMAAAGRFGEQLLKGIFPMIKPALAGVIDLLDAWAPHAERAGQIVGEAIVTIADAARGLFDLFIKGEFTDALASAFGWSEDSPIVGALLRIRETAINVVSFLSETVPPIVSAVVSYISGQFSNLRAWVSDNWEGIRAAIQLVLDIVTDAIQTMVTTVTFIWETWGAQISSVASAIWDYVKRTIENAVETIKTVIEIVLNIIQGNWGEVWNGILHLVTIIWDQILNEIRLKFELAKNILSAGLELIKTLWSAGWEATKAFLAGIWEGIVNTVSDGVNDILQWFRDLPGFIVNAVGDIAAKTVEIGRKIIDGIVDGIVGSAGRVASAVANAIPGAGIVKNVGGAIGSGISAINPFRNADGVTGFRGGLSWVGERGPELVRLPTGADVIPNERIGADGLGPDMAEMLAALKAIYEAIKRGNDQELLLARTM